MPLMRRVAATVYCTASLLAWLIYGPFFHAHSAEEGGELHAHFYLDEAQAGEHSDAPGFDHPEPRHHGIETSAFCGHIAPSTVLFAEIGEPFRPLDPPVLAGAVFETPVRAHDPPARLSSSPRSPPA